MFKSKTVRFILLALLVSFGIGILMGALSIPIESFLMVYYPVTFGALAFVLVFNLLYLGYYRKQIQQTVKLIEQCAPQQALDLLVPLYQKVKGKRLRSVAAINISACYIELKQYEQALEILTENPCARLDPAAKAAYSINVCLCHFYLDRTEEAMALFVRDRGSMKPFEKHSLNGASIAMLDVLAQLSQGERDRAAETLRQAKEQWDRPRFAEYFRYLEEKIAQ